MSESQMSLYVVLDVLLCLGRLATFQTLKNIATTAANQLL